VFVGWEGQTKKDRCRRRLNNEKGFVGRMRRERELIHESKSNKRRNRRDGWYLRGGGGLLLEPTESAFLASFECGLAESGRGGGRRRSISLMATATARRRLACACGSPILDRRVVADLSLISKSYHFTIFPPQTPISKYIASGSFRRAYVL
jgi:hypothetical protein